MTAIALMSGVISVMREAISNIYPMSGSQFWSWLWIAFGISALITIISAENARRQAERTLAELRNSKLKQKDTKLHFAELMAMGRSLDTWLTTIHEMPELTGWLEQMESWVNQTRVALYDLDLQTEAISFFHAAEALQPFIHDVIQHQPVLDVLVRRLSTVANDS